MEQEAQTAERLMLISEGTYVVAEIRGRSVDRWLWFDAPVFVNAGDRYWRDGEDLVVERRRGGREVHHGVREGCFRLRPSLLGP